MNTKRELNRVVGLSLRRMVGRTPTDQEREDMNQVLVDTNEMLDTMAKFINSSHNRNPMQDDLPTFLMASLRQDQPNMKFKYMIDFSFIGDTDETKALVMKKIRRMTSEFPESEFAIMTMPAYITAYKSEDGEIDEPRHEVIMIRIESRSGCTALCRRKVVRTQESYTLEPEDKPYFEEATAESALIDFFNATTPMEATHG